MSLSRAGSRPFNDPPAEYFTGTVYLETLSAPKEPARASAGSVNFAPGARSAWHTHPLGQTLIVTSGCGWHQIEGQPIEIVRAGDVVSCPPGTRHWHGATATTAMTHIAITESIDGKNVEWMEKVSDDQYAAAPKPD